MRWENTPHSNSAKNKGDAGLFDADLFTYILPNLKVLLDIK